MTTKQTEMSTKPETQGELPPLPEGKAVVRGPVSAFRDPESGTLVDFDCEGPLSHDPEDGEELFTADQMHDYARAALLAADAGAGGEVVLTAAQQRMLHDFPSLQQFHTKHALGPMLPPSCLCCGQQTHPITRPVAVKHLELPGIVICKQCKDASL